MQLDIFQKKYLTQICISFSHLILLFLYITTITRVLASHLYVYNAQL